MASWHDDNRMPLAGVLLILGVVFWAVAVIGVLVWRLL